MALLDIPPGLRLDRPPVSASPYWRWGYNVRVRQGCVETLGLFARAKTVAGAGLSFTGSGVCRTVAALPAPGAGRILMASSSAVEALAYDAASTPATGTCWGKSTITPAALPVVNDVVTDPSAGIVEVPPVWWFSGQEDIVVGGRAGVAGGGVYLWDRDPAHVMTAISGTPTGAVAGCIRARMLVLLGCTSFTDPSPARFMTVRWSSRLDFGQWTPSDLNTTGELQLEGGVRIVGGGSVSAGVVVWTDQAMALLTETGDPDSVFARTYVDGGRGLCANRAWCEADGAVWWLDETRSLCRWDGGKPVTVPNPIRLGTVERASDAQMARAYTVANQEFGEVITWYPDPDDASGTMWIGLVYNYLDDAWSVWRLDRPAWSPRAGVIRSIGVSSTGPVYFHDLDCTLPVDYLPLMSWGSDHATLWVPEAYDWGIETGLYTSGDPATTSLQQTRALLDHLPVGLPGYGANDAFTATLYGHHDAALGSANVMSSSQVVPRGGVLRDFRARGKALRLTLTGTGHRTVWRFGQMDGILKPTGQR